MHGTNGDSGATAVFGSAIAVSIAIVLAGLAAYQWMGYGAPPPALTFSSLGSDAEGMTLRLTAQAGDPIPLDGTTIRVTVDGTETRFALGDAAGIGLVDGYWRAGEILCVAGADAGCLVPAGDVVEVSIATPSALVYHRIHHLRGFTILPAGGIVAGCTAPVRAEVVGTDITYGKNGPPIPVRVKYTRDGGTTETNLFGGAPVRAGDRFDDPSVREGDVIGFRGTAAYKNFYASYRSYVADPHVDVLKDGSPVPAVPAFGAQRDVALYLEPYVEGNRISLESWQAIVLYEFNPSLTSAAADFQDLVLLVTFPGGGC